MIRILIVDDDKLARKGLETMMPWEEYGMQVVGGAANGAKALEELAKTEVDLMFVDLSMPVMNGLDLIKTAKQKYPALLYVVLTFHEDFPLAQQAMRLGVLDYISKLELEDADYDALCRRLRDKVEACRPSCGESAPKGPLPEWTDSLRDIRWIYDHVYMEELIRRIEAQPVSQATMEHAIIRSATYIESIAGIKGPVVPLREHIISAPDFLPHYRERFIQRALSDKGNSRLCISLLKVIDYVARHLGGNLQTDHMAKLAGLSRPYFSNSFSKEVGIPYYSYLRRERVEEAKRLLADISLSLSDISARVGYSDLRSFSRLFLEHEGITPAAFRQRPGGRRHENAAAGKAPHERPV